MLGDKPLYVKNQLEIFKELRIILTQVFDHMIHLQGFERPHKITIGHPLA